MALIRVQRLRRASLLVPLLLSSACLSVPDLGPRPEPREPESFAATFDAPDSAWPADRWWEGYGDPQLATLIGEALAGSPTMAGAEARIRRAMDNAAGRRGGCSRRSAPRQWAAPSKSARISVCRCRGLGGLRPGRDRHDLRPRSLGRNRANMRAALSRPTAIRAEAAYARLTLSTAIAASYADLGRSRRCATRPPPTCASPRTDADDARERGQRAQNRAVVALARIEPRHGRRRARRCRTSRSIGPQRHRRAGGRGADRGRSISLPARRV